MLKEVVRKIQKGRTTHPVEPKSLLSPVSADQLSGHAYNRPRGPRSPPRAGLPAPTYFGPSGSHSTLPRTPGDQPSGGAPQSFPQGSTVSHRDPARDGEDGSYRHGSSRRSGESHSLQSSLNHCQDRLATCRHELSELKDRVRFSTTMTIRMIVVCDSVRSSKTANGIAWIN